MPTDRPFSDKRGRASSALPPSGLAEEVLPALARRPSASSSLAPAPLDPASGPLLDWLDSLPGSADRQSPQVAEAQIKLVSVELEQELYGLPIEAVQEVVRVGTITRVPSAPEPFLGITSLRGKILPVLDLRRRLGLPSAEPGPRRRILVVELEGRLLGLLVDAVQQVLVIPSSKIQPPPQGSGIVGAVAQLSEGRLILLLDLDRLLGAIADA